MNMKVNIKAFTSGRTFVDSVDLHGDRSPARSAYLSIQYEQVIFRTHLTTTAQPGARDGVHLFDEGVRPRVSCAPCGVPLLSS
jgi:hypothetical protein